MINIDLLKYMSNIDNLRHLVRYQNAPRISNETVAEHSFFVAAYVLKLADYYNFDLKIALSIAILHDYAEIFISDVPHPIKQQFPELSDALAKAEYNIVGSQLSTEFTQLMRDFNTLNTAEGSIVALADILSCISYSKHEINIGNSNYMKGVLDNSIDRITSMMLHCRPFLKSNVEELHLTKLLYDYSYNNK